MVTTKKVARKLGANCCSSGGGSFRLAQALLKPFFRSSPDSHGRVGQYIQMRSLHGNCAGSFQAYNAINALRPGTLSFLYDVVVVAISQLNRLRPIVRLTNWPTDRTSGNREGHPDTAQYPVHWSCPMRDGMVFRAWLGARRFGIHWLAKLTPL